MPPSVPTPTPTPIAPRFPLPALLAMIIGVLVVGIGAGVAGYHYWQARNTNMNDGANTALVNTTNTIVTNDQLNTNAAVNTNSTTTANTNSAINANTNTAVVAIAGNDVAWNPDGPITTTEAISITRPNGANEGIPDPSYYRLGTVKTGTYKGDTLYLVTTLWEGPALYPAYIRFVVHDGKRIVLTKISDTYSVYEGKADVTLLDLTKFTTDTTTTYKGLIVPTNVTGPKARQTLVLDTYPRAQFNRFAIGTLAFKSAVVGNVWTKVAETTLPGYQETPTLDKRNGFYVELADGSMAVYRYQPDFIGEDNIPNITWTGGTKNTEPYSMTDLSGCGGTNYASVMSPLVVDWTRDLVKVGTSSKGDTIYGFKDANNLFQKRYYDEVYQPIQGAKSPYATFVAAHPLIFFVDPFDRLIKLQSTKYGPQVECGKPVIYLYPPSTTDVHVDLRPAGGFTYTEPVYRNGWDVRATPTGQLTELSTGTAYPYLFWEGRGGIYQSSDRGFVIPRDQVSSFLDQKLALLGLNPKETADFKEFWVPRMQSAPWYFVTFAGNRIMDQLAPLQVTPKPDTIIRILMDFKELPAPIVVQPLTIMTPVRTGFTVVEWGGVLR